MKEVAQAQLAFWEEKPHIAFARAGRIFADDALYEEAFEPDEVIRLRATGDEAGVASFVNRRLLAVGTLQAVTSLIKARGEGLDRKWRSLAYHLVWILGRTLADQDPGEVLPRLGPALEDGGEDLLDGLIEFATIRGLEIPRSLKSMEFANEMAAAFWDLPRVAAALERVRAAVNPES